jgi:hypothetical protein
VWCEGIIKVSVNCQGTLRLRRVEVLGARQGFYHMVFICTYLQIVFFTNVKKCLVERSDIRECTTQGLQYSIK